MIKNILFDWSGVINDNLLTVYKTAMIMFKKFGFKEITLKEFKQEWEQPYMIFYNKYMPGVTQEEEAAEYKSAYKLAASEYPFKLYPGIKGTLQKFKKAGVKMVVISSDPYEHLMSDIKEFGLQGLFNEINNDVHDKAEIIQQTLKRNQFNPKETIFIGDTTHEVNAGKSANTLTAAVIWGFQNEDKLKTSSPDFIIHNLEELESVILD